MPPGAVRNSFALSRFVSHPSKARCTSLKCASFTVFVLCSFCTWSVEQAARSSGRAEVVRALATATRQGVHGDNGGAAYCVRNVRLWSSVLSRARDQVVALSAAELCPVIKEPARYIHARAHTLIHTLAPENPIKETIKSDRRRNAIRRASPTASGIASRISRGRAKSAVCATFGVCARRDISAS